MYEHKPKKKFVAECSCDPKEPFKDVRTDNAPRERMCPKCGKWVTFHEETVAGPNLLLE